MDELQIQSSPYGKRVRTQIRVRLSETDALGVVYYGSFFIYLEVARLNLIRAAGLDLARPWPEGNLYIVNAACDYKSFARYRDLLTIETTISRLGRSSIHFRHDIWVQGNGDADTEPRICAKARDSLVWLDPNLRPAPLPESLRQSLIEFLDRRSLWSDGQPKFWRVQVGSENPAKLEAARNVFARIDPTCTVGGKRVNNNLPRQPWGDAETRSCAVERARQALAGGEADLGIGMESGLVVQQGQLYVTSWCAVAYPDGSTSVACGAQMPLPADVKALMSELGPDAELGPVIDKLAGVEGTGRRFGAIGVFTGGLLDRQQAWENALIYSLAPYLQRKTALP